jgi:hypothetical protein
MTAEIMAETALPEVAIIGAELQSDSFDHARDLAKHEAVCWICAPDWFAGRIKQSV